MTVILGRFEFTEPGMSPMETQLRWDSVIGHTSGTTRHYLPLTGSWSGSFVRWSLQRHRRVVLSVHSWDEFKKAIPWVAVANGDHDDVILANLTALRDAILELSPLPPPIWLGWHHEPENEADGMISGDITGTCGTPDECQAAGKHFLELAVQVLGTHVRIGQTLMAGTYSGAHHGFASWLPSNAEWFGVDGYNSPPGSVKKTFANIFTPAHEAASQASRRLVIQEMGCVEIPNDPGFKAQFFTDARAIVKGWRETRIVEYSNVQAKGDYHVNTTPESLAAFQAWAGDPYYRGDWT